MNPRASSLSASDMTVPPGSFLWDHPTYIIIRNFLLGVHFIGNYPMKARNILRGAKKRVLCIIKSMGLLLNVKKFISFVDVADLSESDALDNLVNSYGIKRFDAERAIATAVSEGFVELKRSSRHGQVVYEISSLKARYFIRTKFKIPYGVFNYWFEMHKSWLTVLTSAATALIVVLIDHAIN